MTFYLTKLQHLQHIKSFENIILYMLYSQEIPLSFYNKNAIMCAPCMVIMQHMDER